MIGYPDGNITSYFTSTLTVNLQLEKYILEVKCASTAPCTRHTFTDNRNVHQALIIYTSMLVSNDNLFLLFFPFFSVFVLFCLCSNEKWQVHEHYRHFHFFKNELLSYFISKKLFLFFSIKKCLFSKQVLNMFHKSIILRSTTFL